MGEHQCFKFVFVAFSSGEGDLGAFSPIFGSKLYTEPGLEIFFRTLHAYS
jgi:hypothetical protein